MRESREREREIASSNEGVRRKEGGEPVDAHTHTHTHTRNQSTIKQCMTIVGPTKCSWLFFAILKERDRIEGGRLPQRAETAV